MVEKIKKARHFRSLLILRDNPMLYVYAKKGKSIFRKNITKKEKSYRRHLVCVCVY